VFHFPKKLNDGKPQSKLSFFNIRLGSVHFRDVKRPVSAVIWVRRKILG
jgi:hypothetical protein